ncbi:8996_t:CDS:10 [Diversispora eburnea]|uniref:8996_t:CDS:1 n=1 Tax=Diversispora eburnea TaxID=1213867 RepID=A0A9N8VNW9_9GLOM|nr:8996_t:CDS:10 [Diversispora eburnea]
MDRQSESVMSWDVNKVHSWLSSLGFSGYESQIKEQGISGEILVHLDHDALKELGVRSVGHRVTILKAIYNLKIQHNVPVEVDEYIPPSAEFESAISTNGIPDLRKIEEAIQERDTVISHLSKEVQRLTSDLTKLREELIPIWKMAKENKEGGLSVQVPGISITNYSRSPTTYSSDGSSAPPSPRSPRNNRYYNNDYDVMTINDPSGSIKFFGNQNISREPESYKSFRVSLEDPCYKVLPAALKKYKISDDWRQYALFICFGSPEDENSTEENPEEQILVGNKTAVAIYPYVPELEDELNVTVGDVFKIKSKAGGWCYVEKDEVKGWVPANFLLETSVNGTDIMDSNSPYVGRGVALIDYVRNTEDELGMKKDDVLRIYKKQDYWLYCEINEERGWVPSWYVRIDKDIEDDESEVDPTSPRRLFYDPTSGQQQPSSPHIPHTKHPMGTTTPASRNHKNHKNHHDYSILPQHYHFGDGFLI